MIPQVKRCHAIPLNRYCMRSAGTVGTTSLIFVKTQKGEHFVDFSMYLQSTYPLVLMPAEKLNMPLLGRYLPIFRQSKLRLQRQTKTIQVKDSMVTGPVPVAQSLLSSTLAVSAASQTSTGTASSTMRISPSLHTFQNKQRILISDLSQSILSKILKHQFNFKSYLFALLCTNALNVKKQRN